MGDSPLPFGKIIGTCWVNLSQVRRVYLDRREWGLYCIVDFSDTNALMFTDNQGKEVAEFFGLDWEAEAKR